VKISNVKRKAYVVLGMHRSGTSTLSGILNLLGLYLGKNPNWPNSANPKGFFENYSLQLFNESLLEKLSSNWHSTLTIPEQWWNKVLYSEELDKLNSLFDEEYGDSSDILLKDPRMCVLLPIYLEVMRQKMIQPSFLISFRHPEEVANSLAVRDEFHRSKSLNLWLDHMLRAEYYSRGFPRLFIDYNDVVENPLNVLGQIVSSFDIPLPITPAIRDQVTAFVEPGLKHHFSSNETVKEMLPVEVFPLYQLLLKLRFADAMNDSLLTFEKLRKELLPFFPPEHQSSQ